MRSYSLLTRHPGNVALFRAVELSLLASLAGWPLHLHVEGLRGTGKTTILRSARGILPPLVRIKGCPYNCEPHRPHCPLHAGLEPGAVRSLEAEEVPMPFCEISHSAKVGTVAGSIDLSLLASGGKPAAGLLPGTLARAHRGIVFVDEINRLADTSPELTDLLLDAMGTRPGRLQIEETGLATVELPLQVTVWAASNPDEDPGPLGDIRRQLADRFDLNVNMSRARSRDTVLEILVLSDRALQALAAAPAGGGPGTAGGGPGSAAHACGADGYDGGQDSPELRRLFRTHAGRAGRVMVPASIRRTIAELYVECGLESLRTVEAVQVCARAACALDGRDEVNLDDLRGVLPLVLGQRVEASLLERFLARVEQECLARPAAAARPDAAGTGPAPSEPGRHAAPGEAGVALTEGWTPRAAPPSAGARRECGKGRQSAPAPATTEHGAALRLGLDGLFARLAARVRGTSAVPRVPGGGGSGGADGAGDTTGGGQSSLEPGLTPVLAPPERARALSDLPPESVLRLPDGAGGGGV